MISSCMLSHLTSSIYAVCALASDTSSGSFLDSRSLGVELALLALRPSSHLRIRITFLRYVCFSVSIYIYYLSYSIRTCPIVLIFILPSRHTTRWLLSACQYSPYHFFTCLSSCSCLPAITVHSLCALLDLKYSYPYLTWFIQHSSVYTHLVRRIFSAYIFPVNSRILLIYLALPYGLPVIPYNYP